MDKIPYFPRTSAYVLVGLAVVVGVVTAGALLDEPRITPLDVVFHGFWFGGLLVGCALLLRPAVTLRDDHLVIRELGAARRVPLAEIAGVGVASWTHGHVLPMCSVEMRLRSPEGESVTRFDSLARWRLPWGTRSVRRLAGALAAVARRRG